MKFKPPSPVSFNCPGSYSQLTSDLHKLPRRPTTRAPMRGELVLNFFRKFFKPAFITTLATLGWACNAVWASSSAIQTDQVKAELIAYAPQGLRPGQTFWVGLKLTHQPQWHTYWKNPGDSGLPTQLTWSLPSGFHTQELLWPTPSKLYVSNLTNYGFEGSILLVTPVVTPAASLIGTNIDVGLHASWLVCKQECVPQEGDFQLKVPVKSSSALEASAFTAVLDTQPIELPHSHQVLEIKGTHLVGQIRSLPKQLRDLPVTIFPELSEVIADPKQNLNLAAKANSTLFAQNLDFEQHPMRSTEPHSMGALLVFQTPQGQQTYHTVFEIEGTWPKLQQSPPLSSIAGESTLRDTVLPAQNATQQSTGLFNFFASYPFLAAALGALLGGMILNLMPCVLPILAIKVLSLTAHSQDTRLYRRHSSGYSAGVICCFSILGGIVVGLKAIGLELGWGFQLQSPLAVATLCFLFLLIALNLLDVFHIHFVIPNRLLVIKSKDPGIDGFLAGLLSVVVAAPCTAPFMGASLGWAMTAANWQGLLIFVCLGIGMALPILLISYVPALGRFLPRPGNWMNTMRVFLAFPMLLTVTWLLWVFGQQLGLNEMTLLMVALITFSALIFCLKLKGSSKFFAFLFFASLLIFEYFIGQSFDESVTRGDYKDSVSLSHSINALVNSGDTKNLNWETWSPELVQQTLAQGRPVFVDFTAAWCITCQVNERTTLQNESVKSLLLKKNVRLLRADWTQPNEQIASTLASLGRSGIPVYLLLSPEKQQTMLSELLNINELTRVLNELGTPLQN